MIDNNILDEALKKKDKEMERTIAKNEETKKELEQKVKNMMSSINQLQIENKKLIEESKDNKRVVIINNLKKELKDQEQVISLLRKYIGDEEKVDKMLLKEFNMKGPDRILTYEELKIKIKQLEADIVTLKYKQTTTTGKSKTTETFVPDNSNVFIQQIDKLKEETISYQNEITILKSENINLIKTKEKLESMQKELFEKIKEYNKEIGDMRSIYDVIKKNIEDENSIIINDLNHKVTSLTTENKKMKEKIVELIERSEKINKENSEKIKKIIIENEVLKRLIETKEEEIKVLDEELKSYLNEFGNNEGKSAGKYKKLEAEMTEIRKTSIQMKEKYVFLEKIIKERENEIERLKEIIKEKDEIICDNQVEIQILEGKISELECFVKENRRKEYSSYV